MLISIIVAMSENRVIGRAGTLPWQLPGDLQRFQQLTMGHHLLMGRKTYQSIGRPLPGRKTLILSRETDFPAAGCELFSDLALAVAAAEAAGENELFICGGAEIYRQALPLTERIYLTELMLAVEGDSFFPELPPGQFRLLQSEAQLDDGQPCRYSILERCR